MITDLVFFRHQVETLGHHFEKLCGDEHPEEHVVVPYFNVVKAPRQTNPEPKAMHPQLGSYDLLPSPLWVESLFAQAFLYVRYFLSKACGSVGPRPTFLWPYWLMGPTMQSWLKGSEVPISYDGSWDGCEIHIDMKKE